jgi:cysteine desulfurase
VVFSAYMFRRRIYLDYAAAAPETRGAARAYARAARVFANPSSIHSDGVAAHRLLAEFRAQIASIFSAHQDEIVLCGGGTESDNLAVLGAWKQARLNPVFSEKKLHIITTAIEHAAVLEACRHAEAMGAEVTYLGVGPDGRIDLKELRAALRPETILVSIAYANNEIGVVQPIREIAKEIRHFKKNLAGADPKTVTYPLFHTDACQTAAYLNTNVEQLGVDLLTANGTKIGGPRGTALLYVRRGTPVAPMFYGGGQESGLRSGTENLPGAAGLSTALSEAAAHKDSECVRLTALRDFFIGELIARFPEARINGSTTDRLPNNVHVSFPKIQSELLVLELDARGIRASAGSACSSAKETSSHVLEALYGKDDEKKWGSVRFSFGRATSKKDLQKTLIALEAIFKKYTSWR